MYPISAVAEPASSVISGDGSNSGGDGLFQQWQDACLDGPQQLFDLGLGLLNRIEVGRVGRQIQQLCAAGFD